MKVLKFCELFFHFFLYNLIRTLKNPQKRLSFYACETKLIHVNTEKNPYFYFFLKIKCDEKIFFSCLKKYTGNIYRKK